MAVIDDDLKKLEYISLVSKVCTELETHLGFGDKVLAEFITEMGRNCGTVDEFDAKLKENGAEMPDYFVRTLLIIIHTILPPKPKSEDESTIESNADGKKTKFKALAIADNRDRINEIQREIEMETKPKKSDREEWSDEREEDMRRGRGRDRDRGSHGERDQDRRRERDQDRHRERDQDRHRKRDQDRNRDMDTREKGRERYDRGERHRDTRQDYDMGRQTDRSNKNRRDVYEEEEADRRGSGNRRGGGDQQNGHISDEPELYQVYKGRVSKVMDTGCFVQFTDFKGKEGLVHVSQMATRRIGSAKDVVKRDQQVYVKVISISGQKLSLSMRDVDQHTGEDLLPLKKRSDDDDLRTNPSISKDDRSVTRTGLSGIRIVEDNTCASSRRPLKRMSSPEKWEAKQLIASGVFKCY